MKNLQAAARHSIQVQLESSRELDAAIIQRVKGLKAERKFTATFRDMAALFFSLQEGDTSVLVELFPWLLDAIEGAQAPRSGGSGNADVLSRLDAIQRRLDAQQPGGYLQGPAAAPPVLASGNLKALAGSGKALLPPDEHDDLANLLEVKDVSGKGDGQATQNFINSMLSMQSAKSDKPATPSKPARNKPRVNDLSELIVISQTQ